MLKLKIQLLGTEASRVVIVPPECTLESLHEVIQRLFRWNGSHLWMFKAKNDVIWEPASNETNSLFKSAPKDPSGTCVGSALAKKGASIDYIYDFGDNWRHRITRMTDPQSGSRYGCVKTAGPDGVEDCGGAMGLANETVRVPTLTEVNGRLPKELKTCDYTPSVSEKNPDEVTLRDAVSSKSTAILSQVSGAYGEMLSREKCIELTLKGFSEHPEALMLFLVSIEDRQYRVMTEAMTKGVAVLENPAPKEIWVFEEAPYVYVEQKKRDTYRIIAAREVRQIWQRNCMMWGVARERCDEIDRYASAAARLYGAISIDDFIELLKRYDVLGSFPEAFVDFVLEARSLSGLGNYVVAQDELRWACFDEDKEFSAYASFLEERHDVPRCTTLSNEEFLAYADEGFVEDCESVRKLQAHIGKSIDRSASPEVAMTDIVVDLVCGYTPGEVVARFAGEYSKNEMFSEKLMKMVAAVRDSMRLPIYNGHTYQEVQEIERSRR